MQVENLSTIEKELWWKKACDDYGVKMVLTDGDDTLWYASEIFVRQMNKCAKYLSITTNGFRVEEKWLDELKVINDGMFERYGVHPERWEEVMDIVGKNGNLSANQRETALETLNQIYKEKPRIMPGARQMLDFMKRTGTKVGLVTHAEPEWTKNKLRWLGFNNYFDWDDVYLVEARGHKTKDSWKAAMDFFGESPIECLVLGDSPRTDINPVQEIGVRPERSFLIENGARWRAHNRPVDQRTNLIGYPNEMIDVVVERAWNDYRPRAIF